MELIGVFFFILVLKLVYSTMVLEYIVSPKQDSFAIFLHMFDNSAVQHSTC